MEYSRFDEISVAKNDLVDDFRGFLFAEFLLSSEETHQIAVTAIFSDDVTESLAFEGVIAPDYVLVT